MTRARTGIKMLIALVVVMTAICVFNTSIVKASNDEEGDFPFNLFSLIDINGNDIEIMGQGDYEYQEVVIELKNITTDYYIKFNTGINLGTSITLNKLGSFTLVKTYNGNDNKTYYEYKSELKKFDSLEAKKESLEYDLKNVDTNKEYHFTLELSFIGEKTSKPEEPKPVATTDKSTNIKLETTTAVIPAGTTLTAEKVTTGENYNTVIKAVENDVEKFVLYDISLVNNNAKVQPNGKVKVSIPVPEGYDTSKIVVYRVAEDGTKTKYDVTVKDGYITFETDHFSNYVVGEEKAEETTTTPTTTSTSTTTNNIERKLDSTPKTGEESNVVTIISSILTIVSALGLAVVKKF